MPNPKPRRPTNYERAQVAFTQRVRAAGSPKGGWILGWLAGYEAGRRKRK